MSKRRKREPAPKSVADLPATADRSDVASGLLLAGATALLVATPLIPSESTIHEGTGAPLNMLWLLLLFAWAALLVLRPGDRITFGWTGICAAALIGWHSLSALTAGLAGNGRQALNMLWQFAAYGVAALLFRQLLRSPQAQRAIVAVMIGLASLQATQGFYQYFVSQPQMLAEFAANPQSAYEEAAAVTEAQRQQLRWRLESKEPLGTFALTNSLAGLLAPALIVVLGIGLTLFGREGSWLLRVAVILLAALLAGCLLLTKSRTGLLAAGGGVALLALYGRSGRWQLNWKIPAAVAAAAVVLALLAVAVGGLDVQVLSQAPTSVLYRLQYWQSTAAMIADSPLFGCGPGQFQSHYTRYKLPQASETIADPHNFLLEIWATAGTPALLATLAMAAAFVWQMSRAAPATGDAPSQPSSQRLFLYAGGVLGLVLAFPLRFLIGWPPPPVAGFPLAFLAVWLLDGWVTNGRLPKSLPVIALVVLLVNLLAAGATSYPGVFLSVWLLVPLALAHAEAPAWTWRPARSSSLAILLGCLVLTVACARTQLNPVLASAVHMERADLHLHGRYLAQAEDSLLSAAAADGWSPDPWQSIAELRLHLWIQTQSPEDWEQFLAAANRYAARDPRHHSQFTAQGNWRLTAWRRSGERQHLHAAMDAYRQAVAWYPNRALVHAQLAWALHLDGQIDQAAAAAEVARTLDAQNPHREQKLDRQTIYDPQISPAGTIESSDPSAEQIVRRLRTESVPELPP